MHQQSGSPGGSAGTTAGLAPQDLHSSHLWPKMIETAEGHEQLCPCKPLCRCFPCRPSCSAGHPYMYVFCYKHLRHEVWDEGLPRPFLPFIGTASKCWSTHCCGADTTRLPRSRPAWSSLRQYMRPERRIGSRTRQRATAAAGLACSRNAAPSASATLRSPGPRNSGRPPCSCQSAVVRARGRVSPAPAGAGRTGPGRGVARRARGARAGRGGAGGGSGGGGGGGGAGGGDGGGARPIPGPRRPPPPQPYRPNWPPPRGSISGILVPMWHLEINSAQKWHLKTNMRGGGMPHVASRK